jgi:WD40 repeat protein
VSALDEAAKPAEGAKGARAAPEKLRLLSQWKSTSPLFGCRFDPLGRFLFTGSQDSKVRRWALDSGSAIDLEGHESWVRGLAFDPKGETFFSGGYDGRLMAWPAADAAPRPRWSVDTGHGWVRAVAASPDGARVATCGNDGRVKLWSAADGRLERALDDTGCHVYHVLFHPRGRTLASADLKGVLREWDFESGKCLRTLDAGVLYKYDEGFRADIGGIRGMAFSADGARLACGGITNVSNAFAGVGNPLVLCFDWEKGALVQKHVEKKPLNGVAWGVAMHPEGFLIAATGGGGGGLIYFWRPDAAEEFFAFKLPSQARDLALHPDGLRLATVHYDQQVRLWSIAEA